jgi:hypothetical protein
VRELLLTTDGSRHEIAVRLFIELNKEDMKKTGLPWFLPEDLGGLGIPCLTPMRSEWQSDATLAAYLVRSQNTQDRMPKIPNLANAPKRPCDVAQSKCDMEYLKFRGYKPRIAVDPTFAQLKEHEGRPKAPIARVEFVPSGIVPPNHIHNAKVKAKVKTDLKTLYALSQSASDLHPMDLDRRTVKVLWLTQELSGKRDSSSEEVTPDLVPVEPVDRCQLCNSRLDEHYECTWFRK